MPTACDLGQHNLKSAGSKQDDTCSIQQISRCTRCGLEVVTSERANHNWKHLRDHSRVCTKCGATSG